VHAVLKQRCFKGKRPVQLVKSTDKVVLSMITSAMQKHTSSSNGVHASKASTKGRATVAAKASSKARTGVQHSVVKLSQRITATASQSGSVTSLTSSDYRVLI
jgi:hypothetical protein